MEIKSSTPLKNTQQNGQRKVTLGIGMIKKNQEAHGPHRTPEKNSSNQLTHGNIITLIKRRKKPSLFL